MSSAHSRCAATKATFYAAAAFNEDNILHVGQRISSGISSVMLIQLVLLQEFLVEGVVDLSDVWICNVCATKPCIPWYTSRSLLFTGHVKNLLVWEPSRYTVTLSPSSCARRCFDVFIWSYGMLIVLAIALWQNFQTPWAIDDLPVDIHCSNKNLLHPFRNFGIPGTIIVCNFARISLCTTIVF